MPRPNLTPSLSQGKGSGDYWAISWMCWVSSIDFERPLIASFHDVGPISLVNAHTWMTWQYFIGLSKSRLSTRHKQESLNGHQTLFLVKGHETKFPMEGCSTLCPLNVKDLWYHSVRHNFFEVIMTSCHPFPNLNVGLQSSIEEFFITHLQTSAVWHFSHLSRVLQFSFPLDFSVGVLWECDTHAIVPHPLQLLPQVLHTFLPDCSTVIQVLQLHGNVNLTSFNLLNLAHPAKHRFCTLCTYWTIIQQHFQWSCSCLFSGHPFLSPNPTISLSTQK